MLRPCSNLVPFHQMVPQAIFCMGFHLVEYLAEVPVVKVPYPATQAGVQVSHHIVQWYRRQSSIRLLIDAFLNFRKRFRCRGNMAIPSPCPPTLAHPDFKSRKVEAFFPCIHDAGLVLVQREFKLRISRNVTAAKMLHG